MTDDEAMALGLRAVATKHWRWMGGMKDMQGRTVTPCILFRSHPTDTPDFRDPATMGCLVHLVREAWDDPCACVFPIDYGPGGVRWVARLTAGGRDMTQGVHASEAEGLVTALEAASA